VTVPAGIDPPDCPSCGLVAPCEDDKCAVRKIYRCESCHAPFPSPTAAERCAELDDFTD
jgi:hypothetical protein